MNYYRDELSNGSKQNQPISFREALRDLGGKKYISCQPTQEMATASFRRFMTALPEESIKKAKLRFVTLLDGTEFRFLSEFEVERGNATRGIDFVWVE